MKPTLITSLVAALSCLAVASYADIVVLSEDFESYPLGPFGNAYNYGDPNANPASAIVTPGAGGTGQCLQLTANLDSGVTANCGVNLPAEVPSGNTSVTLSDYTLEFDMALNGVDPGGFYVALNIFGPGGSSGLEFDISGGNLPGAGSGFQHYTINLGTLPHAYNVPLLNPAASQYNFQLVFLGFPPSVSAAPEAVLLDNIQVTMSTPTPVATPTLNLIPATPGLRMFAQNSQEPWNTEGMLTTDTNQSWVGATPSHPRSYSFTFADFNTVAGFTFTTTFVPNNYMQNGGPASSPYTIYFASNALALTLTKQVTGFGASMDWRTGSPTGPNANNVLMMTTTDSGIGTWTLTFTNDTGGTLTAPGGSPVSFALPADMAAQFANPCTVYYGITPWWDSHGYGQYIDISRITITNVAGVNEDDDFTKDASLNTNLWDTGFSLDAGSVIQVSTSTPYWLTWTYPDGGFESGLETKANLADAITPWYSPEYWNGITPVTKLMGTSLKWTLIPTACLPTVDGSQGGVPSTKAFFRLSNPGPTD